MAFMISRAPLQIGRLRRCTVTRAPCPIFGLITILKSARVDNYLSVSADLKL